MASTGGMPSSYRPEGSVVGLQQAQRIVQTLCFLQEKHEMSGVNSVDNAEFFGPEASNPSQNEPGNVG
uniref:Uncharacterized protein n=1 Tax=Romanomermis culicivorax TaxID=13658 RepID=A0A915JD05_ROMCU